MDRQQKLIVRAALNSAYMKETAENLVQGYRNLDANPVETKLGQALKGALDIIDFDLEVEDVEPRERTSDDGDEPVDGGGTDTSSKASTDEQQ